MDFVGIFKECTCNGKGNETLTCMLHTFLKTNMMQLHIDLVFRYICDASDKYIPKATKTPGDGEPSTSCVSENHKNVSGLLYFSIVDSMKGRLELR